MPYTFKFYHLASLCKDIRKNNKSLEHFQVSYNQIVFDCVLDIDANPFEMMIGVLRLNFAFTLYIQKGYQTTMSYKDYIKLVNVLNLNASDNRFTSFHFLKSIDDQLPEKSSQLLVPIDVILNHRRNQMTNHDKQEGFVFSGWLTHEGKNNGHVREENLNKTKLLLGTSIEKYCRKHDISSKWTTDIKNSSPLIFPWE